MIHNKKRELLFVSFEFWGLRLP